MTAQVDLNLLVPLAALLEHRSVTAAAHSLDVGQPAMSAALARLRRLYSDELLVRKGQRYELTPLARSLREVVGMALELATTTLSTAPGPDPAALSREFCLGVSEYELAIIGGPILSLVRRRAPQVKVHFDITRTEHLADLPDRLRHMDCMVVQDRWLSGYPAVQLWTDELCCAVSADNTAVPDLIGPDDAATQSWTTIGDSTLLLAVGVRMLRVPLAPDRVVSTTDSHIGQMTTIAGTDLMCPMPRRLVDKLGAACGVRPVEIKSAEQLSTHLVWHPARERDHGLTWFRDLVVEASGTLPD